MGRKGKIWITSKTAFLKFSIYFALTMGDYLGHARNISRSLITSTSSYQSNQITVSSHNHLDNLVTIFKDNTLNLVALIIVLKDILLYQIYILAHLTTSNVSSKLYSSSVLTHGHR